MRRRILSQGEKIDTDSYLTIEALEDGVYIIFPQTLEYAIDGIGWKVLHANTISPVLKTGQTISVRGSVVSTVGNRNSFSIIGLCSLKGNCMSISEGPIPSFYSLFGLCNSIKEVSEHFLPATTLATNCYGSMFKGCTSLINAPKLPATTLAERCYSSMFYDCTNLVNAPELPATSLETDCYGNMFANCESLVNAPELPATTLANNCYNYMFTNCTNLVNAPELPATTLASYCYNSMFANCKSLVNAPELPATTLANRCYYDMFKGCTSLVNAPELPATTVVEGCYSSMFYDCTNLVNAPELPATRLASSCYSFMFKGCTSLNYIKMLAIYISADQCLRNWVYNVSPTGTFVKNPEATWDVVGDSGVPEGWTVKFDGEEEGLDTWLEFPLYLDFDACDNSWFATYCYRNPDDTSEELVRVLKYLIEKYGVPEVSDNRPDEIRGYRIMSQTFESLGINIYFKELKVIEISFLYVDGNNFTFYLDGSYEIETIFGDYSYMDIVIMRDNGELFIEY